MKIFIFCFVFFVKLGFAKDAPLDLLKKAKEQAEIAIREDNLQKALAAYNELLSEYSNDIVVANDVAVMLAGMGKLAEARDILESAIGNSPKVGSAFLNLREILARQASIEYTKAIDKKPPESLLVLQSKNINLSQRSVELSLLNEKSSEEKKVLGKIGPDIPMTIVDNPAEAIERLLFDWANAWESKNFEDYISYYGETFRNKRFASLGKWSKYRKPRVSRRGSIKLTISKIDIEVVSSNRATATFNQRYQSGQTRLFTRKQMRLIKIEDEWKIIFEG